MSTPNTEHMRAQAFDLVQQGQDAAMKLVGALSESWTSLAQGAGTPGAPGAASASSVLPGGPAEMIDRMYDTGVQMLEAQRAMAHGVLDAAGPALRAFTTPDGMPGR
jgi:hypothetical protein